VATRLIDSWRHDFQSAVSRLAGDDRVKLDEFWHPHGAPVPGKFIRSETVKTRTQNFVTDAKGKAKIEDLETFKRHLYSDANGDYPMVATDSEKDVIANELAQPGLLGWYRNPCSGAGGLSVS
jgi:hypothetical protein